MYLEPPPRARHPDWMKIIQAISLVLGISIAIRNPQ
jgi:hypothetical protein